MRRYHLPSNHSRASSCSDTLRFLMDMNGPIPDCAMPPWLPSRLCADSAARSLNDRSSPIRSSRNKIHSQPLSALHLIYVPAGRLSLAWAHQGLLVRLIARVALPGISHPLRLRHACPFAFLAPSQRLFERVSCNSSCRRYLGLPKIPHKLGH